MADAPPILPLLATAGIAGMLSAGGLYAYSVFAPRCQFWAPVVRSLPQRDGVALTFEDGPDPEYTPRVLDVLAQHGVGGVKATFFVIGARAREHPDVVRRVFDEGHALANHSLDHDRFSFKHGRAYWHRQIGETQKIVTEITGEPPMLFRPPGGYKTRHVAAAAGAMRLPIVGWSVKVDGVAEKLEARALKRIAGHDVVLLRDGRAPGTAGSDGRREMVKALGTILRGIEEKRLRAVTLIEALVAASEDMKEAAARIRAKQSG